MPIASQAYSPMYPYPMRTKPTILGLRLAQHPASHNAGPVYAIVTNFA